jgi:hypothetical protein
MKDQGPPLDPADEEELRSAAALARALEGGADEPDVPRAALETAALLRLSAGVAELGADRREAIKNELLAGLPARSERRRRSRLSEWVLPLPRWLLLALPLGGTALVCLVLFVKSPEPEASFSHSFVPQEAGAGEAGRLARATRVPGPADEAPALVPREAAGRGSDSFAGAEPEPPAVAALPAEDAPEERAADTLAAPGTGPEPATTGAQRAQAMPRAVPGKLALADQPGSRAALVGLDKDVRAQRAQLLARSNDPALARAHRELDGAQSRDELEHSRAELIELLQTAGDGLRPDDARQVRQDVYCRLAETALRLGEPRAALEWTRRGIELDGPPSAFLAQLMALEGDALTALGEPSSAAASYMKALRVHEALLDDILDGP